MPRAGDLRGVAAPDPIPATRRRRPAPIPSITDLARRLAPLNRAACEIVGGSGRPADEADRVEATEALIHSSRPRDLSDAAVLVMMASDCATQGIEFDLAPDHQRDGLATIRRMLDAALPLVAEAARLDLLDIGADYYASRAVGALS